LAPWRFGRSRRDSLLVARGSSSCWRRSPTVDVVASTEDLESLVRAVEEHEPDVVLTDIRMPPLESDEGIEWLPSFATPTPGWVWWCPSASTTTLSTPEPAGSGFREAYPAQGAHPQPERAGVERYDTVARGGSLIDPKVVEIPVSAKATGRTRRPYALTTRRTRVLAEIAQGKQATRDRGITRPHPSERIEKHINSIFTEAGIRRCDRRCRRQRSRARAEA